VRRLYILSGGTGDPSLSTGRFNEALRECGEVYAFDRMADQYGAVYDNITRCAYPDLIPLLESSKADIVGIIVSGDAGFYSAAGIIRERLGGRFEIVQISGISSLQYLCAKLGINHQNIPTVSLHGRTGNLLGGISYNRRIFALTGGDHNASEILKDLSARGLCHINVTAGEYLSMDRERIVSGTVEELSAYRFDSLCVLLFENDRPAVRDLPLFDDEFIRADVPMTKQEIRWVSVGFLRLEPGDTVFDIGAGTGSVSVEIARKIPEGEVYAVERDERAFTLLSANREKLGAYNVIPVRGNAAEMIAGLPVPAAVFIGGSGGELERILDNLFSANSLLRVVITAVTLETLSDAVRLLKKHGCAVRISCLNVARSRETGDSSMMIAGNPVHIIAGAKD
jgi:precorrin-6B C5,15-methyltransferase / cobalt-precorrin-6B C5,C15-methyltransferase